MKIFLSNNELDASNKIFNAISTAFGDKNTFMDGIEKARNEGPQKEGPLTITADENGIWVETCEEFTVEVLNIYEETIIDLIPVVMIIKSTFSRLKSKLEVLVEKWK